MKTFIGLSLLIVLLTILTTTYFGKFIQSKVNPKSLEKYYLFVRWLPVFEIILMIIIFFVFADYSTIPEITLPIQDSILYIDTLKK